MHGEQIGRQLHPVLLVALVLGHRNIRICRCRRNIRVDERRPDLADVSGWRVVEADDEPSAVTTLAPLDGADPQKVREWLITERRIVTTAVVLARGVGVDRGGAADLATPGHHRRRSNHLRRGAQRRDGGRLTVSSTPRRSRIQKTEI